MSTIEVNDNIIARPTVQAPPPPHIIALGLGNVLWQDDGIGVHAIRELKKKLGHHVYLAETETLRNDIPSIIESAKHVLVIGAIRTGDVPGAVHRIDPGHGAFSRRQMLQRLDSHIDPDELSDDATAKITFITVEPKCSNYCMAITEEARAALVSTVLQARTVIDRWLAEHAVTRELASAA